jgi:hypothetical protein
LGIESGEEERDVVGERERVRARGRVRVLLNLRNGSDVRAVKSVQLMVGEMLLTDTMRA